MTAVKELSSSPWTQRGDEEQFVFYAGKDTPGMLEARKAAAIDRYVVDLTQSIVGATTVLLSVYQSGGLVLPVHGPVSSSWLPEVRGRTALAALTNTVSRQVSEVQRITHLTDQQLAETFPGGVSRETVNRWRNRPDSNLRPENLYRLGLLYELVERMGEAEVDAPVWLHQAMNQTGATPFDLICRGELSIVRQGVERIAAGENLAEEPLSAARLPRDWDEIEDEDDDGDWIDGESDGDDG